MTDAHLPCSNPTCENPVGSADRRPSALTKHQVSGKDSWCSDCINKRVSIRRNAIHENEALALQARHTFGYIMVCPESERWKMGLSDNPQRRLREFRKRYPNLQLALTLPGHRKVEAYLHFRGRTKQIIGEWFMPVPRLVPTLVGTDRRETHFSDVRLYERWNAKTMLNPREAWKDGPFPDEDLSSGIAPF